MTSEQLDSRKDKIAPTEQAVSEKWAAHQTENRMVSVQICQKIAMRKQAVYSQFQEFSTTSLILAN